MVAKNGHRLINTKTLAHYLQRDELELCTFFFFNLGLRLQTRGDRGNGNREDLKEGFRIRMVFVLSCGRKGRALAGVCWACVRKGRTLASLV